MIKICCTCKKERDITEFHKNRTRKDGYQAYCKICAKIVQGRYSKTNYGSGSGTMRGHQTPMYNDYSGAMHW